MKIAIVGYGYLGRAYSKVFPDAIIYDPYFTDDQGLKPHAATTKAQVNECDVALVAVPTDPMENGELDMSIVEEIVDWLKTDLIIIKSALMPGTIDRLTAETGKRIAVSVEYIGMGNYYVDSTEWPDPLDPRKHKLLIVGASDLEVAEEAAGVLWSKMSPNINVHLLSAKEAEIVKLTENFFGALKVTFANCLYSLAKKSEASPMRVHQAWAEDGRVSKSHTRVVKGKRGWKSHCYDKDIQAYQKYAKNVGADDMADLAQLVIALNKQHLAEND